MTSIITTATDRCRRCYSCVRRCPAKAIRVHEGQAQVIAERCVACGRCVKVCSQKAKRIVDNLPGTRDQLATGQAVAMLAPSFPAAFPQWNPLQVVAALRRAGFAGVYEVAFGADLVSRIYQQRFQEAPDRLTITTPCPAANGYIEKYAPELIEYLAPVLSPMAAMGKALKSRLRPGCRTVFIGPCTAKIREAEEDSVAPWVDAVMTFPELSSLLRDAGVDPVDLPEEEFDPPRSHIGAIYPVPGGLIRVSQLPADLLENAVTEVVGTTAFSDLLERMQKRQQAGSLDQLETRFVDVLFCKGCLDGPVMVEQESLIRGKERLVQFIRSRSASFSEEAWQAAMDDLADLDLSRTFRGEDQRRTEPTEEEIRQILSRTGKFSPKDELNCGACGYRSCREKAVAVFKGLAEVDMCLPYLIEQLEATVENLNRSHEQLTEAQAQLIRSERLASMGQLAAGIAHEVNNPLGTILIYAHLLMESAEESDDLRSDAEMILREATRCKKIVGGLLDFARQNKVSRAPVDLRELIDDVVHIVQAQNAESDIDYRIEVPTDLPRAPLDRDQMHQVLVNLVRNAVEVMPEGGTVTVAAAWRETPGEFRIRVSDTGPGIPEEHMRKLFSPFFSTKPVGRGTGLGLPICYGIVKMHRGAITARNNTNESGTPGRGATFEITIPGASEEHSNGR